jgi:hypothetical protein
MWREILLSPSLNRDTPLSKIISETPVLCAVKPDPPDFVAKSKDGEWAIEHTRNFFASANCQQTLQREEARQGEVVSRAKQIYEGNGGGPGVVMVDYAILTSDNRHFT